MRNSWTFLTYCFEIHYEACTSHERVICRSYINRFLRFPGHMFCFLSTSKIYVTSMTRNTFCLKQHQHRLVLTLDTLPYQFTKGESYPLFIHAIYHSHTHEPPQKRFMSVRLHYVHCTRHNDLAYQLQFPIKAHTLVQFSPTLHRMLQKRKSVGLNQLKL